MSSRVKAFPTKSVGDFMEATADEDLLLFMGLNKPKSNLVSNGDLRIDMQGLTTPKNGARYYNLQMQVNKQAVSKKLRGMSRTTAQGQNFRNSTKPTVATILVDTRATGKISGRKMKRAWLDVTSPKTEKTLNKGVFDENGNWTKLG